MAAGEEYLTAEQVVAELEIDRDELTQLVAEGYLKEHTVEGQTRYRQDEVVALKEKLGATAEGEPGTELLVDDEPVEARKGADLLEGAPAEGVEERRTDILSEALAAEDLELEVPGPQPKTDIDALLEEDLELEGAEEEQLPVGEATGATTGVDIAGVKARAATEEEDFFDFSTGADEGGIELEKEEPTAKVTPIEEGEEISDILGIEEAEEDEVPQEQLLSEIMEIDDEQEVEAALSPTEESEEVTAEIAALDEEPGYEAGEFEEVLDVQELGEEFAEGEALEVPYATRVSVPAARVGGLWLALLVVSLVIMFVATLFVVENAFRPDFSTSLTSWASGR